MRWPAIVRKKERRAQSRGGVGVRLGRGERRMAGGALYLNSNTSTISLR